MASEERGEWMKAALGLGVCVMLGLVVGGYLLGSEVRDFKRADRYVEVKGLVERTVKSDSATWTMSFKVYGDDLATSHGQSEKLAEQLKGYLMQHGIKGSEIVGDSVDVTDRIDDENRKGPRFVVTHTLTVHTGDVDRVAAANANTSQLINEGIILGTDTIIYKFGGLNVIKPDMITEATRNARASADRFAADSGSKVGAIRDANQGVFSITAADAGPAVNADEGAGDQSDASIMKKVRVVSTINYYLLN
jgi:hypothetical protein